MPNKLKRKEINRYLRTISKEDKDEDCRCAVCGSRKNIEQHHLYRIYDLSKMAWRNNYDTKEKLSTMYIPTDFLCSKCHELTHQLLDDNYQEESVDLDDIYNIVQMYSKVDNENAPEELRLEYDSLLDDMEHMLVFSFVKYGDLTLKELDEMEMLVSYQFSRESADEIYKFEVEDEEEKE